MKKEHVCPGCGKSNDNDWPLYIDGAIYRGGCQECWEIQCDENWEEYKRVIDGHVKMFEVFFSILKQTPSNRINDSDQIL